MANKLQFEEIKRNLLVVDRFNLDKHANQEAKILSITRKNDDYKLHNLRKLYVRRLKYVMRYLQDDSCKQRAKNTIKNLEAQNA